MDEREGPFKVDPETSKAIRREIARMNPTEPKKGRSHLFIEHISHERNIPEISRQALVSLVHQAKIATPRLPGEEKGNVPRETLTYTLTRLIESGYIPNTDYSKLNDEMLLEYFVREVRPDIGNRLRLYRPKIVSGLLARDARRRQGR